MSETNYENILSANYGFKDPKKWVEFAKKNHFKLVPFQTVTDCPFCSGRENNVIGSFVYYSTYQTLKQCHACKLCFVDVVIDKEVRNFHFELAYKEDSYFEYERKDIFNFILKMIHELPISPQSILEIGGATGVLLSKIKTKFKDSECVLNDLSTKACELAESNGLKTVPGGILDLPTDQKYDLILAIDILYYEINIKKSLEIISECLAEDGVFIFRLPNKYFLSKIYWILIGRYLFPPILKFFNPEHVLLLTQSFIRTNLPNYGFSKIEILPSPLLKHKKYPFGTDGIYYICSFIYKFTQIVLSPSMFVVARK